MSDELLFHVSASHADRAVRISLAEAGLREREHLQEWLLANPDVISSDMIVVTAEFDRWLPSASSSSGRSVRHRLDILGLDTSGRLVVAELKRDVAAETVEMQAIKYAAMVAQFTPATLAQAHAAHLQSRGESATVDEAMQLLEDHADGPLDLKVLHRPRIVLIAGEFVDTTTTSAVWLTQMGVEVDLVRYQAYRTPAGLLVTTSRIWPLEEAENLVVRPEEREEAEETQRERQRSRSVVARIVDAGLIDDGTPLRLNLDNGQLTKQVRHEVEEWLDEDPTRGTATWVNSNPRCLRWDGDGKVHSSSGLASRIVKQATGQKAHTTGPLWPRAIASLTSSRPTPASLCTRSLSSSGTGQNCTSCSRSCQPASGRATAILRTRSAVQRSPSAGMSQPVTIARTRIASCQAMDASPKGSRGSIRPGTTTQWSCCPTRASASTRTSTHRPSSGCAGRDAHLKRPWLCGDVAVSSD